MESLADSLPIVLGLPQTNSVRLKMSHMIETPNLSAGKTQQRHINLDDLKEPGKQTNTYPQEGDLIIRKHHNTRSTTSPPMPHECGPRHRWRGPLEKPPPGPPMVGVTWRNGEPEQATESHVEMIRNEPHLSKSCYQPPCG